MATPAATAGRSIGATTRRKASPLVVPSDRATANAPPAWSRSAARASRYTYGYSVNENVRIATGIERISGNHAVAPNTSRHVPWTGPATPNTDVTTNPRMYAGIASGRTSAHDNVRRPGNSCAPTSHASPTPSTIVVTHTPPTRISDDAISPGSRPAHCSRQTSVFGRSTPPRTAATGVTVSTAAAMATPRQPMAEARAGRTAAVTDRG